MSDKKYWPCEHIRKSEVDGSYFWSHTGIRFGTHDDLIKDWDVCPVKECGAIRPNDFRYLLVKLMNDVREKTVCDDRDWNELASAIDSIRSLIDDCRERM